MDDLQKQFTERLQKNFADYRNHLMDFEPWALFDMAGRIAHTKEVYDYLTEKYQFREGEAAYLLQFQNPLEIVTDAWEIQQADVGNLDFIIRQTCKRQDAREQGYPLVDTKEEQPGPQKKPSIREQLQTAKDAQERQPSKPDSPAKDGGAR